MERIKRVYERFKNLDTKRRLGIIAILSLGIIVMWAFISAGFITSNFNRAQIKNSQDNKKVDAKSVIITETKDGRKYFEIYGETGHYSNDKSMATLYNVLGNFYKDGEVNMSFQSSKGTYDEVNGIITLYENTYIVVKDGISLTADKLTWYGNDKETIAEGHVKINKNNEIVSTADKCIIGTDYKDFKIAGNTTTKVWSKEAK